MINRYILLLISTCFLLVGCTEDSNDEAKSSSNSHNSINKLIVRDTAVTMESEYSEGELNFPLISTEESNRSLDSILYETVSFYAITGSDIADIVDEFTSMSTGLVEMSYTVNYNKNGVFDISYKLVYMGAHLSYDQINMTIDLNKARRIHLVDMLDINKLDHFLFECNEKLNHNIAEAKKGITEESEDILDYYDGHEVLEKNLENFSISENGIVIYFDFFFPHFAKSAEPNSGLRFTWTEIEKYLDLKNDVVKRIYLPSKPEATL